MVGKNRWIPEICLKISLKIDLDEPFKAMSAIGLDFGIAA
jgi:hypothetical protein